MTSRRYIVRPVAFLVLTTTLLSMVLAVDIPGQNADQKYVGETAADALGRSVAGLGNIDGIQGDEVFIAATNFDTPQQVDAGKGYVENDPAGSPIWEVLGQVGTTLLGYKSSVESAGDVNGDGTPDFVAGMPGTPGPSGGDGTVVVYSGVTGLALFTFHAEAAGDEFGYSVAGIGDVDGDQYDDILVGARLRGGSRGRAYIFLGCEPCVPGAPGCHCPNERDAADADVKIDGEVVSHRFGYAVHSAGDFNDDGLPDFIIGAAYWSDTSTANRGRAYVFFGFGCRPNHPQCVTPSSAFDADLTLTGEAAAQYLGSSVGGAGDFNGDGISDIIVGASRYSETTCSTSSAINCVANPNCDTPPPCSCPPGEDPVMYDPSGTCDGSDCSGSDPSGNGICGEANVGRAYIVFGCNVQQACPTADCPGVNCPATCCLGPDDGELAATDADVIITGENSGDKFAYELAFAGDINNDGEDDVIIGAPYYDVVPADADCSACEFFYCLGGQLTPCLVGDNEGAAYVFYGCDSPAQFLTAELDTAIELEGEAAEDGFGRSVDGAGFMNQDSFADMLVGANGWDEPAGQDTNDNGTSGEQDVGRAYVFFHCPWDLTGDRVVGAADLAQLLGAWGACGDCCDCPADFDHDCDVDAADQADLLGHYGACS